ncbi:HAD family hydrolase [Tundrisphaera lichenicola]|uniref:HAD family hydrolase n=1 Tax=Tundrisphaera lichenicola TaxID=2029860 RepID=UPI003EB91D22
MIEAVIFDVDGTLIDTVDDHARAWLWAFARHGHDIPFEDIRAQIGKGGDQLMPVFLLPEEVEHIGETLSEERDTFFRDEYLPHIRPFPMVRELFERIKADGKRIVLASSAKEDELERYKKVAQIEDLIEDSTSSDDAEKSKPHPDIFQAALARLGDINPARVIVVGDTPWDVQAAKKAGLKTIGLLCGGFAEIDLRDDGAVAIFLSPADLLAKYDESPLAAKADA